MDGVRQGQVEFRLHPTATDGGDEALVSAGVFARKLAALVLALKSADRAVNYGKPTHDYKIEKLKSSSPTAILQETLVRPGIDFGRSGIAAFEDCVDSVTVGSGERARTFGKCPYYIQSLSTGATKDFSYGEIHVPSRIVRIDDFLNYQAKAVVAPEKIALLVEDRPLFKGAAHGTFRGELKEVDLRGSLPETKLVLPGGKEIDCVWAAEDIDIIRDALAKRVRLYGRAIYDGKSGLPRRLEVQSSTVVEPAGDFERWKGSFKPFHTQWIGDE